MTYLLDSNIFIQSRKNLPMDIWNTFWHKIIELAQEGFIFTITKVKEEIERGNDDLSIWMKTNLPNDFFIAEDATILITYAETQNWVDSQEHFTENAKRTYASVADAFLVATAKAKNMKLVTFEKSNLQSKKRVLIPDACNGIGAQCCDLNTMFRELGVVL